MWITLLRKVRCFDTQTPKAKADSPSTVMDSSGEEFNILRIAGKGPAQVQSPLPPPNLGSNTCLTINSNELSISTSDSWSSTVELLDCSDSRSSSVTNPRSSSPAHRAQERCNNADISKSDEELDRLLYEASEVNTESRKSSDSRVSVDSKENHGVFVTCWQSLIAWIYGIFAKLFRRSSNA